MPTRRVPILLVALVALVSCASAQDATVRVATYNIKFLSVELDDGSPDNVLRKARLLNVIRELNADVIGLQEIKDFDALDTVFPRSEWIQIIDEDSGSTQDVAMVVRKSTLGVVGHSGDRLDADDEHFLFEDESSTYFPNRRDVLAIDLKVLATGDIFTLMVVHTKSRYEKAHDRGRATNDYRREGAARLLVQTLEAEYDGARYALIGDFNDNPDDRSLNILETGDPDAVAGPENVEGEFLVNLTESLLLDGHVSHGRGHHDVFSDEGVVDTIDPDSRQRNNDGRGTNKNTGDILFDLILVSHELLPHYLDESVRVFDAHTDAVRGNDDTRASDHLPVFADFSFSTGQHELVEAPLTIHACLPNPHEDDAGHETVTLRNNSDATIDLAGHTLTDRAGHTLALRGTIGAGDTLVITIPAGELPLNNTGEDLALTDGSGVLLHEVSYTKSQVSPGVEITF